MNAQEAYKTLQKEYPLSKVIDCLDFGDFFAFTLAPIGTKIDGPYCTGPNMYSVDKKTNKTSIYNILSDPNKFLYAEKVDVKDIMDTRLSEVRLN